MRKGCFGQTAISLSPNKLNDAEIDEFHTHISIHTVNGKYKM